MFREYALIVRRAKLYCTASRTITYIGVIIPETVLNNFALQTMSTCPQNM